jgi:hypothetical protein
MGIPESTASIQVDFVYHFRLEYSHMNNIISVAAVVAAFTLSGCMGSGDSSQNTPTEPTAVSMADLGKLKTFDYSANGKAYTFWIKEDKLFKKHKVIVAVKSGKRFTGDSSEDVEVQNTMRDGLRANGMCANGLHPGLIQFGYSSAPLERGDWGWFGFYACSEKFQKNI